MLHIGIYVDYDINMYGKRILFFYSCLTQACFILKLKSASLISKYKHVSYWHLYIKESDPYYHNQCVSEKHEDHNDTFSFYSLKIVSIQTNR